MTRTAERADRELMRTRTHDLERQRRHVFKIDTQTPHLWRKISREAHVARAPLTEEMRTDIIVIGGGLTGLSTALALAERGRSAVVLEAGEIGSGASGRNNGFAIPQHTKASPDEIDELFGAEKGRQYNAMVAAAADNVFRLVRKHRIQCDPVDRGWIHSAHNDSALGRVRQIFEQWASRGADVQWLDRETLSEKLGSDRYRGGWLAPRAGHINPYAFCQGMARAAEMQGVSVFENSTVEAIERKGSTWSVRTGRTRVVADHVVIATDALTTAIWPDIQKSLIPIQVYIATTRPLPADQRARVLRDNVITSDTRRDLRSWRFSPDGRLVTGGTHTLWRSAERRGLQAASKRFQYTFPQLGEWNEAEEYWEGVFALVPNSVPRVMLLAQGLIFAGIYSGRGVALAASLGEQIGRWLTDEIGQEDLPIPVTAQQSIFAHAAAVQVARRIHPYHRFRDELGP